MAIIRWLAVTERAKEYIRQIIPVGWMRCTCGERLECPRDCERFIGARKKFEEFQKKMFEDFIGS